MDIQFNKNEDSMKLLVSEMRQRWEKLSLGGGKTAIDKQHEKNKLTARERIAYLRDSNRPFIEIGAFAGDGMYAEYGGCPAAGTVAGIGYISGRQCVIVANDQTVKAGAWFPITGKKISGSRRWPWKTCCLSSTLSIVRVFFFHCKMKYFQTKNTLEEFSGTMQR